MQVAIVCAGFTPSEADQLRRSMATFKVTGGISHFKEKLIAGMVERHYTREFAEQTVSQIEGFGSYGFPESHAASFALIAYASSWMKCHHPDVFCCALLNAQPMGFYAPAQIVRDAQAHGVEVRPVSRQPQPMGLHAGADGRPVPGGSAGHADGEGAGERACSRDRRWPAAITPIARLTNCGAARACLRPPWNGWRRPMLSRPCALNGGTALWAHPRLAGRRAAAVRRGRRRSQSAAGDHRAIGSDRADDRRAERRGRLCAASA